MSDDPPPVNVEVLDEWDHDTPAPPRRPRTWLIGPLALVAVVAIVIAVVLGGTKQAALTVTSSPPATPSATSAPSVSDPAPTSWATLEPTVPSGGFTYTRVDVTGTTTQVVPIDEQFTPDPIPSSLEAEPLVVTLLDHKPRTAAGVLAYNVRICVATGSAAANGGKVRVSSDRWTLGLAYGSVSPMTTGGLTPAFPVSAQLGAGQCASGWVSFPLVSDAKYISLYYGDERFSWSWRIS